MQLFTSVGLMAICSTLFYSMSVFTWCSGSPLGGVSATTYFPDREVAILIDPTALREIKKNAREAATQSKWLYYDPLLGCDPPVEKRRSCLFTPQMKEAQVFCNECFCLCTVRNIESSSEEPQRLTPPSSHTAQRTC